MYLIFFEFNRTEVDSSFCGKLTITLCNVRFWSVGL